jgi:hypothetical protein
MSLPLGARFASMALLSRRDAELVRCGRESARRLGLESEWGVRARMRRRRPTRRASGQHRARDQAARTGLGRGASTVVKIGTLPVRGCDHDVAVQPHVLRVVLGDVRVVPVQTLVREPNAVREPVPDGNRLLRIVRHAVEAVLQPHPVPVNGGLDVAVVRDVHDDLGALPDAKRRARDGSVVCEHSNDGVTDRVGDRSDPQIQFVPVGQPHGRRRAGRR